MTDTITRIDYAAARKRLASITTDPAALAGFDRIRETGDLDNAFMAVVVREDISLDWIFLGKGAA
jgi:hypothetical protein